MSIYVPFDYALAVGKNFVAGLVRVQQIVATSEPGYVTFDAPLAVPGYTPGIRRVRLDGRDTLVGNKTVRWLFGILTWYQYDYLSVTYCAGGYSGDVTIRTRTGRRGFANYSAVMHLPFPNEMQAIDNHEYWEDVNVTMTDLELIPDP